MSFKIGRGTTFMMKHNVNIVMHLSISLNDPVDNKFVLVNITSIDPTKETKCIISVGDHPWISKESCVYYAGAQIVSADKVEEYVTTFSCAQPEFSEEIFLDILCCAFESDTTPNDVKEFLNSIYNYNDVCCD
jgi:hypothetical protein